MSVPFIAATIFACDVARSVPTEIEPSAPSVPSATNVNTLVPIVIVFPLVGCVSTVNVPDELVTLAVISTAIFVATVFACAASAKNSYTSVETNLGLSIVTVSPAITTPETVNISEALTALIGVPWYVINPATMVPNFIFNVCISRSSSCSISLAVNSLIYISPFL